MKIKNKPPPKTWKLLQVVMFRVSYLRYIEDEEIINLAWVDIMLIIIIISLVIHISSLIATVVSWAKYKMLSDNCVKY